MIRAFFHSRIIRRLGAGALAASVAFSGVPVGAQAGFDDVMRDSLRLNSPGGREAASTASDLMQAGLIIYPAALDIAMLTSRETRPRGWEWLIKDASAFAVTTAVTTVTKHAVGRERPYGGECAADPSYDSGCGEPIQARSFFSGHTSHAFTGAALICSKGDDLPSAAGGAMCGVSMGLAATTGVLRIAADKHYFTDVVVGAAVGLASGFLVPDLIPVDFTSSRSGSYPEGEGKPVTGLTSISPTLAAGGVGIKAKFRF